MKRLGSIVAIAAGAAAISLVFLACGSSADGSSADGDDGAQDAALDGDVPFLGNDATIPDAAAVNDAGGPADSSPAIDGASALDGSGDDASADSSVDAACPALFDPTALPATAVYGLRALVPSYQGPLVRIQRQLDGGADGGVEDVFPSGGDFPLAAVSAWAAGAQVYVATWYDQMGEATSAISQATETFQPELVLDALNGRPGVRFTASEQTFLAGSFPWVAGNASWSAHSTILGGVAAGFPYQPIFDYGNVPAGTNQSVSMLLESGGKFAFAAGYYGTNVVSTVATVAPATYTLRFDGGSLTGDVNGNVFSGAIAAPDVTASTFWVGGSPDQSGIWLNATLADVVLFPSAISSAALAALQANDRACYAF